MRLTAENVVGIRSFADTLNCASVVQETDRYIQKNFVPVSKSEEFSQLPISDIQNILSRDELHIESEEQVVGFIYMILFYRSTILLFY
jgi:hypothetical protein